MNCEACMGQEDCLGDEDRNLECVTNHIEAMFDALIYDGIDFKHGDYDRTKFLHELKVWCELKSRRIRDGQ